MVDYWLGRGHVRRRGDFGVDAFHREKKKMNRTSDPRTPEQDFSAACILFEDALKAFIKNRGNDASATHMAARILFDVRRMENHLTLTRLSGGKEKDCENQIQQSQEDL